MDIKVKPHPNFEEIYIVKSLNENEQLATRNLTPGKKVYEETGGLENIPFSVTEDYMILNSIHNLKRYELIHPVDKSTLVISKPCSTIKELLNQKKRWAVGGIDAPILGKLLMLLAFITNVFVLLTTVF